MGTSAGRTGLPPGTTRTWRIGNKHVLVRKGRDGVWYRMDTKQPVQRESLESLYQLRDVLHVMLYEEEATRRSFTADPEATLKALRVEANKHGDHLQAGLCARGLGIRLANMHKHEAEALRAEGLGRIGDRQAREKVRGSLAVP